MDTSNIITPQFLVKYINGEVTPEERVLLNKSLEGSSDLKDKFEELSDPDNWWDCFWYQQDIDTEEAWEKFKMQHIVEQASGTGIQINWWQTLLKAVAVVVFVGGGTSALTSYIKNVNQADQAEANTDRNLLAPDTVAQNTHGYLDIADKGRLDLEKIPVGRMELPGSSLFNQGAMFTIENNGEAMIASSTIKLVTAQKQVKLQLPDGSRVTLNKNSCIVFSLPFDITQRAVGFYGEGFFEVESNPNVPFVVQLNNKALIQAYGTTFAVSYNGKECLTTLLRGHVTVTTDGQTKTLSEGEQVQMIPGEQTFKVVSADPTKVITWTRKNGFDYKDIEFKQMMREIGSWFGYGVYFVGEMPQSTSDIILNEDVDLDYLLKIIEKEDNVQIQKTDDKKLIVTSK